MRVVPISPRLFRGVATLATLGTLGGAAVAALAAAGCMANDPLYMPGPTSLEAGVSDPSNGGRLTIGKAMMPLPIKGETVADKKARDALSAKLAPVKVPYVKIGDIEIEIAWTVKNLDQQPGQAQIGVNGANEFFAYDPSTIKLDPDNKEAPPTPDLAGDIPIDLGPGEQTTGVFTEDDLREAAIDLDAITRGNLNPFAAWLQINKNETSFQPLTVLMPGVDGATQSANGPPIPREAFAEFVQINMVLMATTHMTMSYDVRVRDLRGIMHPLLLAAETEKPGELAAFTPTTFTVSVATTPTAR